MKEIYSNTEQGIVWLGDYKEEPLLESWTHVEALKNDYSPTQRPEDGIATAAGPGRQHDDALDGAKYDRVMRAEVVAAFDLIQVLANGDSFRTSSYRFTNKALDALAAIMRLSWWHRMWTIQEVVLPAKVTVVCGGMLLPWSTFSDAAHNIFKHDMIQYCSRPTIKMVPLLTSFYSQIEAIEFTRRMQLDFLIALHLFRRRLASDNKDKVFALLGLSFQDAPLQKIISADYSLDWRQVFQRTAAGMMRITSDLSPLLRTYEPGRDPTLPSWLPDWRASTTTETGDEEMTWWIPAYDTYNASKGAVLEIRSSKEGELKLKGTPLCKVGALIGNSFVSPFDEQNAVAEWHEQLGILTELDRLYPSGGTYAKAFYRSIRSDTTYDTFDTNPFRGKLRRLNESDDPTVPGSLDEMVMGMKYRRLFLTKTGLIGSGPMETKSGDVVYILHGGRVPFILRRCPQRQRTEGDFFFYIGHAFIHGIMDGQALSRKSVSHWVTLV